MGTGNVASFSVLMNVLHQPVHFQQANAFAATLGVLNIEKVRDKEETAEKKIKDQAEKVKKKRTIKERQGNKREDHA